MQTTVEKLKLLHDAIHRQIVTQVANLDGVANQILLRRIHSGMLHAIIDMAVEHELNSNDMEEAISNAIGNMVNCYLTGTIHQLDIETAKETAAEIMVNAMASVLFLVERTFVREATNADPIQ